MKVLKKTTILSGFLGSGKTTYLNYLLKSNPSTRYAIVENEFGEESIDGDLILRTSNDIVELNNGCLCCSLNENLYDLLSAFYLQKDAFDELIIEATGVADPASIAEPFLTHPAIKKSFELIHTICIIDAEQIEDQLKDTEEARKQIAFSDVLLIAKTDLVSPEYIHKLREILNGINPLAQVLVKDKGSYPAIPLTVSVVNHEHEPKKTCNHNHHHHKQEACNHSHDYKAIITHQHTDIVTHSFVFNEPFNINELYHQLLVLLTYQSKDIYRFKGIVYTDDPLTKFVIQSVGKRLGMEELQMSKDNEIKLSKFVFIGKNLKPDGFRKLLERCINKTQEHIPKKI